MDIREEIKKVKLSAPALAASAAKVRNRALLAAIEALNKNSGAIFEANRKDMEQAKADNVAGPLIGRLKFDEHKMADVCAGMEDLAAMDDPLFKVQLERQLDEGLILKRVTCPIGVIGVIFEARPDALVQISALCIKSGNCVILKGGSEAMRTNRILFETIQGAVEKAGLPKDCMLQLEARSQISELLGCHGYVDLLIPRGSNSFVQYIMDNTKIPVMGHADGICHVYADKAADIKKAVPIIFDSKTQYVSACNAAETLLVHEDIASELLPAVKSALEEKNVVIRGDKKVMDIISCEEADEEDNYKEYLDYIISVKIVSDIDEAIEHVNYYGSHHTDCIITEDKAAADRFMDLVDSAGVYVNCSTRFADGFRYGFGAEVGISTGKIHARGPVGLEGLVSYKYRLSGNGQIVADYASGKSSFHFKDL